MFLEVSLVRHGVITAEQFVQAVEWQLAHRPRLGRLALETGKLSMKQVFAVLEAQTDNSKPFGETAVDLGFLKRRQVNTLLKQQAERTPPLAQCLIEIGAVRPEVLEQAGYRLRHEQTHRSPQTTVPGIGRTTQSSPCLADEPELAAC